MISIDTATEILDTARQHLREAAVAYVSEAALFGERDSDSMAELEAKASEFHTALVGLRAAEGDAELREHARIKDEQATSRIVRLPRRFYDHRRTRDLPVPEAARDSHRYVWVDHEDEHFDELVADAKIYARSASAGYLRTEAQDLLDAVAVQVHGKPRWDKFD